MTGRSTGHGRRSGGPRRCGRSRRAEGKGVRIIDRHVLPLSLATVCEGITRVIHAGQNTERGTPPLGGQTEGLRRCQRSRQAEDKSLRVIGRHHMPLSS